jgi:hypothetical protein
MRDNPPAICHLPSLIAVLLLLAANTAEAAKSEAGDVTLAARVVGDGETPIELRIAVPPTTGWQQVTDLRVKSRGFKSVISRGDENPHVTMRGIVKGARRVAVSFRVQTTPQRKRVPPVEAVGFSKLELFSYLRPSPLFQSRSILVREFLEQHVAPTIADADGALMRPILQATREALVWKKGGKSLTLDVIRSGGGQRIGIERAFTTFLRCARVPARFVEGIKLESSTRRKRVFWTEVWAKDAWYPVSASRGWVGRRPGGYVALTSNGDKAVKAIGASEMSYRVHVRPVESTP